MSDDDDRTSAAPPSSGSDGEKQRSIIRLAVPPWLLLFNVGGTMLAVRMMMTTSYVQPWHLEKLAVLGALVFGLACAVKIVLLTKREERDPPRHRAKQLALIAGLAAFPTVLPVEGCLALANRVGRLDDTTVLRCTAGRVESRVRLDGRRNVVFYACTAPDGTVLRGRADEMFPVEPGGQLTLLAARGRLGAWIRLGPPEPVSDAR